jgi:hypothetical protein
MADLISMLAAASGATAEADPNFKQTVLLLHGDGTNGAQNNTFLDGSTNNFTITRNGNTTQGTFSPFSGADGYWSNFFDGTNDRLTIADNAALRPGTSNFTIEAWVYRAAAGAAHTIFAKGASTPTGFAFLITSSDTLRFTDTSTDITSTGTVAANTWVHVAAVREGTGSNQLKLYINGVQDGTGTSSTDFNQTEEARIGENRGATDDFNGYISNFRYVIGTALYTAGFTPSTSPLTTTSQGATSSEVELLTCQSNRFLDNSTNAFTVSRVNDVRVTPFSPFAPSAAYDPAVNGGSGYFDGSGDFLQAAANSAFSFGSGDFTIECWYYPINFSSIVVLVDTRSGAASTAGVAFYVGTSGQLALYTGGTTTPGNIAVSANGAVVANAWNHLLALRSGSSVAVYVNGASAGTGTNSFNFTDSNLFVGRTNEAASNFAFGYLSNVRVVKGSAVTPPAGGPTAPLTAVSGTSILLNFTNAGIFDNTGKNNLETVADAQIDTGTKKYGTGSMEFDGTGDYLTAPDSPDWYFGTGNFTLEFWYRPSALTLHMLVQQAVTDANRWILYFSATNGMSFDVVSSTTTIIACRQGATTGWSTNTWYHVALVRNGNNFAIYRDGTSIATLTDSDAIPDYAAPLYIGGGPIFGDVSLNGFIDDLRITKGVARYTAAFTPPTKAFPDQ